MTMRQLSFVMFVILMSACVTAQSATNGADRSVTYAVNGVNDSAVTGSVFIGDFADATIIVIAVRNTPREGNHPAHFHAGNCGSGGGVVVPLSNVNGATGVSVTVSDVAYDAIVSGDHYLNIHASPADMGTIVACTEVGLNAALLAGQLPNAAGTTNTPVQTQEFISSPAYSYGIFSVAGSPVTGNLQVSELAEGGSKLTLSLVGIVEGRTYTASLYEGDCGPDRPEVLTLNAVGPGSVDTFASITEVEIAAADIAQGNHFIYVFERTTGDPLLLACGEVGVGANR